MTNTSKAKATRKPPKICVKRIYDPPSAGDGARFLVDRLWPRGMKRSNVALAGWLKEVAPSNELRRWFGHDPSRWEKFVDRYHSELDANLEAWKPLLKAAEKRTLTLLFAAKDAEHNNAVALRQYLQAKRRKISDPIER